MTSTRLRRGEALEHSLEHPESGAQNGEQQAEAVQRCARDMGSHRVECRGAVMRERVDHERMMRRALDEARAALLTADVPVGAVVVGPDGAVIATGRNEREATADPTAHAELLAIRAAAAHRGSWRLEGCSLIVTLEPCVMCAGAIVAARLPVLVFGAWDEKAGASGSLYDIVRDRRLNHRVEVFSGVLAEESARLLSDFFRTTPDP